MGAIIYNSKPLVALVCNRLSEYKVQGGFERGVLSLLLPASAKRSVKLDETLVLVPSRLRQCKFRGEE